MIGLPSKFECGEVEREFLDQYRRSGLRFVRLALLLGAGLALVFFALVLSIQEDEIPTNPRQALRLALFVVMGGTAALVALRPAFVVKNYVIVVGSVVMLASISIGAMSLVPVDLEEPRSGRWTVAMSLTCWLAYGFTRLPVRTVAGACFLGSAAILVSAHFYGDDYVRALLVYLLMANLIGWIMSVEIERRERALFWSSRQLSETTRALEEMARNASEANAARTRVLAAVSHDLRQPLASLSLYASLLRARGDVLEPAGLVRTVDRLEACATALSGNLDRLSELGGLRDREAPLPVEATDLRLVFERIESVYAAEAARRGVRLVVRAPRSGCQWALSNANRLWDVLSNLTGNALKFAAPDRDAWVVVRARLGGRQVAIEVRDNGIGIDAADQRRVFDEYFQVDNPARSPGHGHGLGLSIVRETVSRLPGHSIELTSRPGCGTRFTLTVPVADSPAHAGDTSAGAPALAGRPAADDFRPTGAATTAAGAPHCESPRHRYLVDPFAGRMDDSRAGDGGSAAADAADDPLAGAYVLFIDDDDSMRDALDQMLQQWGVLVETAASGEEALRLAADSERTFDAIVSDFRLPGEWDGLRLIDELRRMEGARTPAILVSGEYSVEALRRDAPGDVEVMAKPLDLARLRTLLTEQAGRVGQASA